MSDLSRRKGLGVVGACSLAALAVTGCGGSSHHATHPNTAAVAVTSAPASTSTTAPAPGPAARLRIIAPRPGAATSQTLTVRLSLTGGGAPGPHLFRYVLDGTLVRLGSARLTFHGLAFGRHHLTVMLASLRSVRTTRTFIVPQPAAAAQAPGASQATTSSASSPATAPAAAAPPPAATTPAPAPTPAPPPTSGIPQGPNAGDADGDNHGGTSDGDGNI